MESDDFLLAGESWYLYIVYWNPTFRFHFVSFRFLFVYLIRRQWDTECSVHVSVGFKKDDGQIEKRREDMTETLRENEYSIQCINFSRAYLEQRMSELLPSGTLTIVVTLRKQDAQTDTTGEVQTSCLLCSTERGVRCVETSTQTQSENSEELRKNHTKRIEACTQTEADFDREAPAAAAQDNKLLRDYKGLLMNGDGCDVTLQVKGQTFEAHQAILRARSSVFASMFSHDMKEKNTSVIDIVDCDPEYFLDFLCFMYCGCNDSITSQNACSLYRASDKYDVQDLKSKCLTFIKTHLDADNFCDVITLALQHSEADLLKLATDFFIQNSLKIVLTIKWQIFLHENTTQGNELLVKAFSANKSSEHSKDYCHG